MRTRDKRLKSENFPITFVDKTCGIDDHPYFNTPLLVYFVVSLSRSPLWENGIQLSHFLFMLKSLTLQIVAKKLHFLIHSLLIDPFPRL